MSDANMTADESKTELLALREQLLRVRETDLFALREKVTSLEMRLTRWLTVFAVVGTVLGVLGIKQYGDLNDLINRSMTTRIEESLGYYEQVSRAIVLVNNGACASALQILEDLSERRPEDEVVFLNAMHCFNDREEYDEGYLFLSNLRARGVFPRRYRLLLSYNNAGFLVLVRSFSQPGYEKEALQLLQRAEQIGIAEDNRDMDLPLYNLTLLHVANGDIDKARVYSSRLQGLNLQGPDWRNAVGSRWFGLLETKRPDARKLLDQLLPRTKTGASVGSTNN